MQCSKVSRRPLLGVLAIGAILCASCGGGRESRAYTVYTGGTIDRGAKLILSKQCGACHVIPGIQGARGLVGPPLNNFGRRTFIAGELVNVPENLVRWLANPREVEPHTAMPSVGLTEQQARDVAAYLYTLQ